MPHVKCIKKIEKNNKINSLIYKNYIKKFNFIFFFVFYPLFFFFNIPLSILSLLSNLSKSHPQIVPSLSTPTTRHIGKWSRAWQRVNEFWEIEYGRVSFNANSNNMSSSYHFWGWESSEPYAWFLTWLTDFGDPFAPISHMNPTIHCVLAYVMVRGGHGSGGSGLGEIFHSTQLSWVWRDEIRWPSTPMVGSDGLGIGLNGLVTVGDRVFPNLNVKRKSTNFSELKATNSHP